METFIVTQGADPVGNVQRKREGLYYAMECRCSLDGEIMYDLMMQCGDVCLDLGILVPEGDAFTLRRRLPVKSAGEGVPEFYLKPRHMAMTNHLAPVWEQDPFAYIAQLEQAMTEAKEELENNAKNTEI